MSVGGFFNTIHNYKDAADESWAGCFENLANACRAPSEWVSAELCNSGVRKIYEFKNLTIFKLENGQFKKDACVRRIFRVISGLALGAFGILLALPLMGVAYTSAEIRLKHALTVRSLSPDEQAQLKQLVKDRQTLQSQRKGCEPVSCILGSICCLLCTLVCR